MKGTGTEIYFPGQTLSWEVYKWHHLAVLKNMRCPWHCGKQNSVMKWSKVK